MRINLITFWILSLSTLSACTPSYSPTTNTPSALTTSRIQTPLIQHYEEWKGTPHHLGTQTKRGIDCSGYTQLTFRELFDLKLPRTVVQQRKFSKAIPSSQLKAGDLVFFDSSVPKHVGIALGDGRFIHVSSTNGVSISSLTSGYWKNKVEAGGRVLGIAN